MIPKGILQLDEVAEVFPTDCVEIARPGSPVGHRATLQTLMGGFLPRLGGAQEISAYEDTVDIVFEDPLPAVPTNILCSVIIPNNEAYMLYATPIRDTFTETGFTAALSAPPETAGYTLSYLVLS